LVVFNLIGLAPQSWIAPITLAVLGLLTISMLSNRYRFENIFQEIPSCPYAREQRTFCIHDWSILNVYEDRVAANLSSFFQSASQQVDILTTNLSSLTGHLPILSQKAAAGVQIRVLALDPTSEFVQQRYGELGLGTRRDFERELTAGLRSFKMEADTLVKKVTDSENRFQIRQFDSLPTIVLFRSDHRLILNFILGTGRGRNNIQIEFDVSSRSGKPSTCMCFVAHFEHYLG